MSHCSSYILPLRAILLGLVRHFSILVRYSKVPESPKRLATTARASQNIVQINGIVGVTLSRVSTPKRKGTIGSSHHSFLQRSRTQEFAIIPVNR